MALNPSPVPGGFAQVSPLNDNPFTQLYGQTKNLIPTSLPSLGALLSQGMNSPLLQAILGPSLQRLMGTEQTSRDAVTDAFRASGGLRSSQYGRTFAENEGNIMDKRSSLISDTIAKNLGTIVPGMLQEQKNMFLPGEEYMNLMKLIRPDLVTLPQPRMDASASSSSNGANWLSQPFPNTLTPENNPFWLYGPQGPPSGSAATGVNSGGAAAPASQPNYNPYGGYGFDAGYPLTYNNNTGAYNTYSSTGPYQDPSSYYAQYGLGYEDPGYQNPNISYGPWQDISSNEY